MDKHKNMRIFSSAGQAEIMRSSQKDELLCEKIQLFLSETVQKLCGNQFFHSARDRLSSISRFLYFALTTVGGYQTLGEEYTGIIMVNYTKRVEPTYLARLMAVFLYCFGESLTKRILTNLEKDIRHPDSYPDMPSDKKDVLLKIISGIKASLPYISKLHTTLFYLNGKYYDISKRLTRIEYIRRKFWIRDEDSKLGFLWLYYVSFTYLILLLSHSVYKWKQSNKSIDTTEEKKVVPNTSYKEYVNPSLQCTLCLEEMCNTSCTPCGHLFCWNCILDWLQTKEQCPLCRETVKSSRVVLLQNYLCKH